MVELKPCPDCTEPAPSAPDIAEQIAYIEQLNYKAVDYMQSDTCKVTAAILRSLRELASARSRIAELESRQPQSAEWVPWKEGDPLPPDGLYWTTWFDKEYTETPMMRANFPHEFARWSVIAYIPQRLPDPYTDAQGKRDE